MSGSGWTVVRITDARAKRTAVHCAYVLATVRNRAASTQATNRLASAQIVCIVVDTRL